MQVIDTTIRSLQIITVVIVVLLAVFGLIGIYFVRFHRSKVKEQELDYNRFNRKDTLEYIKIEDVEEYMVVTEGKKRFVGAVTCMGHDYYDAEADEQLSVIRGYLSFLNVVDTQPIQFWQMARDVNLDKLLEDYQDRLERLNEKCFLDSLDYEAVKKESETDGMESDQYDRYYRKLKEMQREITAMGYQAEQLKAQISYMESISGPKADPHLEQLYIFDWVYNALEYTEPLSEIEIYARAEKQLKNRANAYVSALQNAGVKARMVSGAELLQHMRRYTHPVSAAKFQVEDIVQSAYDSIAVTSNSLREKEEEVNRNALSEMAQVFNNWEMEREADES